MASLTNEECPRNSFSVLPLLRPMRQKVFQNFERKNITSTRILYRKIRMTIFVIQKKYSNFNTNSERGSQILDFTLLKYTIHNVNCKNTDLNPHHNLQQNRSVKFRRPQKFWRIGMSGSKKLATPKPRDPAKRRDGGTTFTSLANELAIAARRFSLELPSA
uniref:Uncharacterized protein n=1 Tax=Romanomermis culicivorax TaxID=13658 RepID=A0A915IH30_ROMCU